MFPAEAFRPTAEKLLAILRKHSIRFHFTGGVTSISYGEPRLTQDLDIVVDPDQLRPVANVVYEELRQAGFVFQVDVAEQAIVGGGMFQLFDQVEALKIDVYPRELIPGELDRSGTLEVFAGQILPIVSRIDLAAAKLIWVSKGSHKGRRDLRQIYRTSSDEEKNRINQLAQQLRLEALLQTVLSEPEEV